jgi:hypothetical protein
VVLSQRARVVLLTGLPLALAPLAAGCKQSLFDAHGDPGATPDGALAALTCPAPCIADAAANFDGTPGGIGGHWRYLEDQRNRTWAAMTASAAAMTGKDPANKITTCKANPTAAACRTLPGALLISAAGATGAADPAIEFTATSNQVIQLDLRALVATGADQTIRLYRNSREDVLFTGVANAGAELDHTIKLDALAGDRFLVALAPTAQGATDVGLHLFVSATGASFPSTCQLALAFEAATGNTVTAACSGDVFTHALFEGSTDTPPALSAGPYTELGKGADLISNNYFRGTLTLDKSGDTTVQLWVKLRSFIDISDAWVFSDMDLNFGGKRGKGGLGIAIVNASPPRLDVATCTDAGNPLMFNDAISPYPAGEAWQFIRVVQAGDAVSVCINGTKVSGMTVPRGLLSSSFAPHLGSNVRWSPQGAFFDGLIDDVRVMTGALPCN